MRDRNDESENSYLLRQLGVSTDDGRWVMRYLRIADLALHPRPALSNTIVVDPEEWLRERRRAALKATGS